MRLILYGCVEFYTPPSFLNMVYRISNFQPARLTGESVSQPRPESQPRKASGADPPV